MRNKRFVQIAAVSIVAGVLALEGAIWYSVHKPATKSSQNPLETKPDQELALPSSTVSTENSSASAGVSSSRTPEFYGLYRDDVRALTFKYPSSALLFDRAADGSPTMPQILFQQNSEDADFVLSCPGNCINFFAFSRIRTAGNNFFPYYDIPSNLNGPGVNFPLVNSPSGLLVYPDETGSKPFMINGAEAVRYYASGMIGSRTGPAVRSAVQEMIFLTDPYAHERIILVTYQQLDPNKHRQSVADGTSEIKADLETDQHEQFEEVLSSLVILPTDTTKLSARYSNPQLGISFQYPSYWGEIVANKKNDGYFFGFTNPPFLVRDTTIPEITIEANNGPPEIGLEGEYSIFQFQDYANKRLEDFCQDKMLYLNAEELKTYFGPPFLAELKITDCKLDVLANGLTLALLKGEFPLKYDEPYEEWIPQEERSPLFFEEAVLKTKSSRFPGMRIYFESTSRNFSELEHEFDEVVSSLSYTSYDE